MTTLQNSWRERALARSEIITDAWEVTKTYAGRIAEWVLFLRMVANIIEIMVTLPQADLRAGGRCEGCGAVLGTLRVSRKGNLYFLPLHTCHVNHDPENPEAELQKLCPRCHGNTHPWLPGKRDDPNRHGYRPITQERVLRAARGGGLAILPDGTSAGYTWQIADLSGNAPDVLDAVSQALHCLRMERLEWGEQREGCHYG